MNSLYKICLTILVILNLQLVVYCAPTTNDLKDTMVAYKEVGQQVQDEIKPSAEPVKQQQETQTPQEPIAETTPVYEQNENKMVEQPSCEGEQCKPENDRASSITAKGNAIAAAATAAVAAPAVIKSAKIAALAGLIPIKLAAKGAIIGGLIAKPIIIKSAIVGATATKLSSLFIGKPIALGANLIAGAESLRSKVAGPSCTQNC